MMRVFLFKRRLHLPYAVQKPTAETVVLRLLIHTFPTKKDHPCKSLHSVVLTIRPKSNGIFLKRPGN